MSSRDDEAIAAMRSMRRQRIEQIRCVFKSYDMGCMSEETALRKIQEIASSGIVHVGRPHTPEVQT